MSIAHLVNRIHIYYFASMSTSAITHEVATPPREKEFNLFVNLIQINGLIFSFGQGISCGYDRKWRLVNRVRRHIMLLVNYAYMIYNYF